MQNKPPSCLTVAVIAILSIGLLPACERGQQTGPSEAVAADADADRSIMLLGVYHFSNPGMDAHNLEVDDYLAEKRQEEIEEVVRRLSAYRPNRVLVEAKPSFQSRLDSLYEGYTAGEIELSEIDGAVNEIYQLGFRLGKGNDVGRITAVDHPGLWLGGYVDFIADTLGLTEYLAERDKKKEMIREMNTRFLENSVLDNLVYSNEWSSIMANHSYYNDLAIRVADTVGVLFTNQEAEQEIDGLTYTLRSFDFENIGVELVTEWYKRNFFIYRNILENTTDGDRALLIIGQGHVRILHQLLSDSPEFGIIEPNTYLNAKNH